MTSTTRKLFKVADRRAKAITVAMPGWLYRGIERAAVRCECSFSRAVMLAVVNAWREVDDELAEDFAIWCEQKGFNYEDTND